MVYVNNSDLPKRFVKSLCRKNQALIDNLIRIGAMGIGDPDLFKCGSGPSNGLDKNPSSFDIQYVQKLG